MLCLELFVFLLSCCLIFYCVFVLFTKKALVLKHKLWRMIQDHGPIVVPAHKGSTSSVTLNRNRSRRRLRSKPQKGFTFPVNTIPGTLSKVTPHSEVLTGYDELHSSTLAVLGNDDLLSEILLRLPVLSLHLYKLVSKQWLSLITSPNFTLSREKNPNIDPPAGLLILRTTYEREMYQTEYDFQSLDIRIPSKKAVVFAAGPDAPPPGFLRILQSCNGLLLCCMHKPEKLYVCNLTIKLFKMLPTNSPVYHAKIAFDPTKSPHYKVIHVKVADDGTGFGYRQIETYSSETGKWSLCGDRFPKHPFTEFSSAVYWNDALHWLITDYSVCSHYNLKIVNEHPVLTKTERPQIFDGKLLESGGSLLLLSQKYKKSRKVTVFEMKNGCSEWSVKHTVKLNELTVQFPNSWRIGQHFCAIVAGEREEDSYMIIDFSTKVMKYNFTSKTLRTLYVLESTRSVVHGQFEAYQFIPSFAGV